MDATSRAARACLLLIHCASGYVDRLPLAPENYGFATNLSAATPYRRKAAVFASVGGGDLVLFSGKAKDERLNRGRMAYVGDAWRLSLSDAARWTRADAGCPGERPAAGSPRRRRRTVARARERERMRTAPLPQAGDGIDGELWIFGGHVERGTKSIYFDDLWALDASNAWREHKTCLSGAWAFDVAAGAWSEVATPAYGCRWGHTATTVDRRVAVFGGRHKEDDGDYDYLGGNQHSVWFYDVAGDAWEEAPALTDVGPKARDHHAAAYVDGGLYVTGGKTTDLAAEAQDDLWRFDVATHTWADLTAGRQPRSRYLHSAATWATAPPLAPSERPELGAMVVFGGEHIKSRRHGKKKYVRYNDVWGYWPLGEWVELIDDRGFASALYLSPWSLRWVRLASEAAVVATCVGVVAVAIYYRVSIPEATY
ncbi:galactose oxidase [Aureococcus anophagefferens]|nr:galactose oxidase [Aureococcus anophagefferens]